MVCWCDSFGCNNLTVSPFHETDLVINHLLIATSVNPIFLYPKQTTNTVLHTIHENKMHSTILYDH